MNFTAWMQSHRRSILFLLSVFGIAGAATSLGLPVGLFPHVDYPRVVVGLDAGDRPAERMTVEVTRPVEEAVRSVPGVKSVRSTTSRGSADVSINFDWGRNMVEGMLEVQSAIAQAKDQLPANLSFDVRRMDPTVFPVLGYSLTSDHRSLTELHDLALYQIRPVLSTVAGVAKVEVQGGAVEEYRVTVDPSRLMAFGLTLSEVADALSAANVLTAVGRTEEQDKLYLILSDTQFKGFDEIAQTVLRSGPNGLVLLSDVAQVAHGAAPQWTRVTADGQDAVLFQVYQQPGGNTVQIAKDGRAKLAELGKRLPPDIHLANWYDQSDLIVKSATATRDAVLIGVVLAALILLLFLRNLRVTLIAAVTVPMVLAATILLLGLLGMSFNIMTLGGMAAAVGLIIDDAIVMIEHVIRRVREGGSGDHQERAMRAAREFTRPLVGSSASTIVIFTPLAFLTGVTGAFFKALSLTMAAALGISFLVAWLAVPLLALHFLRARDTEQEEGGFVTRLFHGLYGRTLGFFLPRPWPWVLLLLVAVPLLVAGYVSFRAVGSGFLPPMDEGGFILDYRAAPGQSLAETDRLLREVEGILESTPEVETYSRRTGLQLGGGVTEANEGDFFVKLVPLPRRGIDTVMDEVRTRVEHDVPGLDIELLQLMEDLIGDLTAVPQPIEVELFSDDQKTLMTLAPKVAEAVSAVDGVVDVNDGIILAGDALDVEVDRQKAALEGVSSETVTSILADLLSGVVTTSVQKGPKMVDLRVWIPAEKRTTTRQIEALGLRASDGHAFPLSRIARISIVTGQPQITRDDLKRMTAVTGRISGRDMGSTLKDVIAVLDQPGLLPENVYYRLGGLYREQQKAFKGLLIVFGAAVALVFLLLLFLYERFRVAIAMMVTTLLAVAAVFIGLWLTGTELNITAMMGMTMVIGIVTEVSIFYYSEFVDLGGGVPWVDRLIAAGRNRMRPIAMTTFAAILALLPLALGIGEGAAMLKPLAIAIISGLVVQLPLVLTVLPALLAATGSGRR